jgi:hypothetical protein
MIGGIICTVGMGAKNSGIRHNKGFIIEGKKGAAHRTA